MKFLSTLLALAAVTSSALASPIEVIEERDNYDKPPKNQVYINGFTYGGSGCPGGSARYVMSDDRTNVAVMFDKYQAMIGPGVSQSENTKNCNLNFNVVFPQGYTFTIFSTEYMGYTKLDRGVKATQRSDYFFTNAITKRASWQSIFWGPRSEIYTFKDNIPVASYIWSPCGYKSTLNVNTQLILENDFNPSGKGLINTQYIGQGVEKIKHKHLYHIHWKKCKK